MTCSVIKGSLCFDSHFCFHQSWRFEWEERWLSLFPHSRIQTKELETKRIIRKQITMSSSRRFTFFFVFLTFDTLRVQFEIISFSFANIYKWMNFYAVFFGVSDFEFCFLEIVEILYQSILVSKNRETPLFVAIECVRVIGVFSFVV